MSGVSSSLATNFSCKIVLSSALVARCRQGLYRDEVRRGELRLSEHWDRPTRSISSLARLPRKPNARWSCLRITPRAAVQGKREASMTDTTTTTKHAARYHKDAAPRLCAECGGCRVCRTTRRAGLVREQPRLRGRLRRDHAPGAAGGPPRSRGPDCAQAAGGCGAQRGARHHVRLPLDGRGARGATGALRSSTGGMSGAAALFVEAQPTSHDRGGALPDRPQPHQALAAPPRGG